MQTVITYSLAHFSGVQVSLCRKHTSAFDAFSSLGSVSHGRHAGDCEGCSGDLFATVDSDGVITDTITARAGSRWTTQMAQRIGRYFVGVESGAKIGDRVVVDEDGNASIA